MIRLLDRCLERFEGAMMVVCMAVAITLTFTQVVLRYVFNAPLFWAEEVVLYAIIWMSFVGISYGLPRASHISVDVLEAFLPSRFAWPFRILSCALGIVFGVVLLWLGWKLTATTFGRGQLSPALRIPMGYVYAIIPFAGLATAFRYALEFGRSWRGDTRPVGEETPTLM
ncbi:TRAP transporter small permease [Allosediminivita pacifica]|uniref:TRAP transporter small permease protein n=1 Tax=Allosediminivita pacifica TaxID=1267769 RepID=A0A2T6BAB6_9RHOB|nr:TRAP transporter small permease [Allosediminivita pacifica]PTX52978.1 TRAP-type C4-dicarboxylate transport system permease small subunit [Allosediminivita pacifica]GGA94039.1 C4-dicarboxylate ABC transporter permease [Allosediminivita pacifica]